MMAVASKLPLGALFACALVGCAGNVVEGLPRDGGQVDPENPVDMEPSGAQGDGGASGQERDAGSLEGRRDAAAGRDASMPPVDDGDEDPPMEGGDAGQSGGGTALNGGALPRPTDNGRTYSADPATWGGDARCDDSVLFCDDMDGSALGNAWTVTGTVAPSSEQKFRGTGSARAQANAGAQSMLRLVPGTNNALPANPTTMFGRLFVRLEQLPTSPEQTNWTMVEISEAGSRNQVRLGGKIDPSRGGKNFWSIGSDGGDTGDWNTLGLEPQAEIETGTWTCVEWMFKRDTNETRVWIDNVELLSLHTTAANYLAGDEAGKTFVHPNYEAVRVGWWEYRPEAQPASYTVYIDDVVLDDDQIGCAL